MYHQYPLVTNSLQSHPRLFASKLCQSGTAMVRDRRGLQFAARLHGGFDGKTIYEWGVFNCHAPRVIPNRGPNILETTYQFTTQLCNSNLQNHPQMVGRCQLCSWHPEILGLDWSQQRSPWHSMIVITLRWLCTLEVRHLAAPPKTGHTSPSGAIQPLQIP